MSEFEDATRGWWVVEAPSYEAWREARHALLTASDVSSTLGLNPHCTRERLLRTKAGPVPNDFTNDAMLAGQVYEDPTLRLFEGALNRRECARLAEAGYAVAGFRRATVFQCRTPLGVSMLVRHPSVAARLAASPDGLLVQPWGVPTLLEVKVTNPKTFLREWGAEATGGRWNPAWGDHPTVGMCPVRHWVQLQTQLACTGLRVGYIVGACGTVRLDLKFEADAAFQEKILAAAINFAVDVDNAKEVTKVGASA